MEGYFKLFSNCIPIKGYLRSVIYDLGDNDYKFIPNELYDILNKEVIDIRNFDTNYLNYLLSNKLGFICNDRSELANFSTLNLDYKIPYLIYSVICFIDDDFVDFQKIIQQLNIYKVKNICLILTKIVDNKFISQLCETVQKSNICTVELVLCEDYLLDVEILIRKYLKINNLTICKCKQDKVFSYLNKNVIVSKTKNTLEEEIKINKIDFDYFYVNMNMFTEALKYNSYYNKKIFVKINGDIFKSIDSSEIIGNIYKDKIETIISNDKLHDLWNINKDIIEVCKDCEFRFMCCDNRIPYKNNQYYNYKEYCPYNPYISKWKSDENYLSPDECGNYNQEGKFVVNTKKVESLNRKLWGE